ncbi:MAG: ribosome-associated translation inhibitor RaiA [Magnetococcales bacterium]|nr:ribosome-associated translation inhibitor RaiA [Magnetococcales bacterium]
MDIKIEGRQVEIGSELQERIEKRMDSLDQRFGPITHARISVEKKAHKNEQRAEVTAVVNIAGGTITASREAATVVGAVNDVMETLTLELQTHVEKSRKDYR